MAPPDSSPSQDPADDDHDQDGTTSLGDDSIPSTYML